MFRLGHSSFFSKYSKFYANFRNGIKYQEKVLRFWDKSGSIAAGIAFFKMLQKILHIAAGILAILGQCVSKQS